MTHSRINMPLVAVHASLWLPLLGLRLFIALGPEKGGGALQYLPLSLIPIGWLLTPAFTLWSLFYALKTLAPGRFDPRILRIITWHKLAMLPVFTINYVLCMAPAALFNPWTFWLIPIVAIPLAIPIALSMGCTWLAMLASSAFVIPQVVLLWRQKTLNWKQGVGCVVLQLIPMLDAMHCLALRARHASKSAPPGSQAQAFPG